MNDILSLLHHGKEAYNSENDEEIGLLYPVLVVSLECVFTKPAKNFWSKVADETGAVLHIIVAEDDEQTAQKYNISGYPCLVCSPKNKFYGMHFSHAEGKAILAGGKKQSKSAWQYEGFLRYYLISSLSTYA